jgi:hypothetical protein
MIKIQEQDAKRAREKREGTYKRGGNIHGFDDEDDITKKKPAKKRNNTPIVCPLCGLKGHKTKVSKKCLFNPANPKFDHDQKIPQPEQQPVAAAAPVEAPEAAPFAALEEEDTTLLLDSADADVMDTIPFSQDGDKFFDCETFEEDLDGDIDYSLVI